jgi:peptide-methionine (S)-S-oxide reductase
MRMFPSASLNQVVAAALTNSMMGEKRSELFEGEEYAERGEASSCDGAVTTTVLGKENHNDDYTENRTAQDGDIITLELSLVPENGFVPEPLFDTMGRVSFVVGWGYGVPGLHQLILERGGCRVNDIVENVSLDAGWGRRRSDLLFTVSKETLIRQNVQNVHAIQPGSWLKIPNPSSQNGSSNTVHVLVDQVTDDAVVLDANEPLAGSSYSCSFRVISIDSLPSSLDVAVQQQHPQQQQPNVDEDENDDDDNDDDDDAYQDTMMTNTESIYSHDHHLHVNNDTDFQVATFALGCFWGAELAFARHVGVVGTRVGYTQGVTKFPTYQQVCSGTTKHRESVLVIYHPAQVSYLQLLQLASQRLDETMGTNSSTFIMFHEDENDGNDDDDMNNDPEESYPSQYKPGFYYHSEEQNETARTFLEQRNRRWRQHKGSSSSSRTTAIELLPAATFYNAEDYHQQYLYKGGQSARKGAKETIRCYG